MMRIPVRKIYRAFPEFDSFSDEQCERFMLRVQLSGSKKALPILVGVLVAMITLIVCCAVSGFIFDMVYAGMERQRARKLEFAMDLSLVLIPPVFAFLLGLFARDLLLRRHLRLVIEDKLNRIRCLGCKYILIGQVVANQMVRCPECGRVHSLDELGVVEADLIPPQAHQVTTFAPDR
jgi:hypothetical protein